jgi:hypothetical protein
LQLESREANFSQAMHWLNVSYSVWLNRKYNRVGPLFQGRFKAILHETTEALVINRYIHLNPVRIAALGGAQGSQQAAHVKPRCSLVGTTEGCTSKSSVD